MLIWTFVNKLADGFSIFLGICLGMKFLGLMVTLCLTFWRNFEMYHFTFPPVKRKDSSFFHILVNTYHCPSFSLYPKWVWSGIFMVLFCISLVTDDAEYLSVCLYNIGYLLWRTVYSNPLPVFKKYLFVWLCQVLVLACGLFVVAHGLLFSCVLWALEHTGSVVPVAWA